MHRNIRRQATNRVHFDTASSIQSFRESLLRFIDKINARWRSSRSLLCVGLDPDPTRMPSTLAGRADAIERFCNSIIDATADHACAFKPQIAYFASSAAEQQLEAVCARLRDRYPDIPLILDAKRGDIGSTATHYAREAFERYGADSVTVSPYMGTDSITPYLEWTDRGIFLLCRTSNAGGDDLQALPVQVGDQVRPLYEHVACLAQSRWNSRQQVGLVVGATYPAELAAIRRIAPDMPMLVPGIGAQGGDIDATVAAGLDEAGFGMLINSSRAILYAGSDSDFAIAAGQAAAATRAAIQRARAKFGYSA